jgi:hypothetical protein
MLSKLASRFRLGCGAATVSGRLCMVALRASIWVLLTTSIIGLAGGALAARKIRLAQATTPNVVALPSQGVSTPTSTVTNCMMNCNSAKALCQSTCFTSPQAALTLFNQMGVSAGNVITSGSCISSCTNVQLQCQINCGRASPSP